MPSPKPATTQPPPRAQPTRNVNPIWDALVAVFGYEPSTKTERSNWGKVVRELKEAGATPEEIAVRADRYVKRYGRERLTINALLSHWSECATEPATPGNGANSYGARANGRGTSTRAGVSGPPAKPDPKNDGIYAAFVD